jgi:hypothetical protein
VKATESEVNALFKKFLESIKKRVEDEKRNNQRNSKVSGGRRKGGIRKQTA